MSLLDANLMRGLVRRELAEYRTSLVRVPVLLGVVQIVLVLLGLFVASQLMTDNLGKVDAWIANSGADVNISVQINEPVQLDKLGVGGSQPLPGAIGPAPGAGNSGNQGLAGMEKVLLPLVNRLFLSVLVLVSVLYLLGTLYNDRRDRSVLFFKSMPVAEWEEIASKLLVALLVVPAIFLLASGLTQIVLWLLLQLGSEPPAPLGTDIPFSLPRLLVAQVLAMAGGLLWVVPLYCWLLLASAAANRSPALLGILLPVVLILAEWFLLDTAQLAALLNIYLPRLSPQPEVAEGVQPLPGLVWMLVGWAAAAVMLAAATWLRRFRFEL